MSLTEYEEKFSAEGYRIYRLEARRRLPEFLKKVNERGRFSPSSFAFQSSGYQYYLLVSARRWLSACEADEILPARQGTRG